MIAHLALKWVFSFAILTQIFFCRFKKPIAPKSVNLVISSVSQISIEPMKVNDDAEQFIFLLSEFNGASVFGDLFEKIRFLHIESLKEAARRLIKGKGPAFQIKSSHPRDLETLFENFGLKEFWDDL